MSNEKFKKEAPTKPFYKSLIGGGIFFFLFTVATTPTGRISFDGYDYSITILMELAAVAMVLFGTVFGLIASISARRAHIKRMQAEAAAAAASDSHSEPSISMPVKKAQSIESAAVFAVPEPRVMVVDTVAKPNVEFPTSAKA